MALSGMLFEAISQCQRLERICLIAKHSVFQAPDVMKMAEKVCVYRDLILCVRKSIGQGKSVFFMIRRRCESQLNLELLSPSTTFPLL